MTRFTDTRTYGLVIDFLFVAIPARIRALLLALLALACTEPATAQWSGAPYVLVLGTAQDGGYPHMGCERTCCKHAWEHTDARRFVTSLALVDPGAKRWWLIEATPDIKEQLQYFQELTDGLFRYLPDGIFITHAHIGHYAGLMQLGREVMGSKGVPVYTMPRMNSFLQENGPWNQLIQLNNIKVRTIDTAYPLSLTEGTTISTFTVPHRDEFSETAGFLIKTWHKTYLFIPDIDKWNKWNYSIVDKVKQADVALLDGTFLNSDELPGRNMAEVPHPLVGETMELFSGQSDSVRAKVHFIHLNHTNPLLWDKKAQKQVEQKGFKVAKQGEKL